MNYNIILTILLIVFELHQFNASFTNFKFNSSTILIPNGKLTENEIIKISASTQLNEMNSKTFEIIFHDNVNSNNSKYIVRLSIQLNDNQNILMSYYQNGIWINLHPKQFPQYSSNLNGISNEFIIELKKNEIYLTINSDKSYSFEYSIEFELLNYITINGFTILENVIFGSK